MPLPPRSAYSNGPSTAPCIQARHAPATARVPRATKKPPIGDLASATPACARPPPAALRSQLARRRMPWTARPGSTEPNAPKTEVRGLAARGQPKSPVSGTPRPPRPRAPGRPPPRPATSSTHETCPGRHALPARSQTHERPGRGASRAESNVGDFASLVTPPARELACAQIAPQNHAAARGRTACTLAIAPVPGGPRAPPGSGCRAARARPTRRAGTDGRRKRARLAATEHAASTRAGGGRRLACRRPASNSGRAPFAPCRAICREVRPGRFGGSPWSSSTRRSGTASRDVLSSES